METLKWIEYYLAALSPAGPLYVILGAVLLVLAARSPAIIKALTDRWKTKIMTRQKLRHQEEQFRQALPSKQEERAKVKRTQTKPRARG